MDLLLWRWVGPMDGTIMKMGSVFGRMDVKMRKVYTIIIITYPYTYPIFSIIHSYTCPSSQQYINIPTPSSQARIPFIYILHLNCLQLYHYLNTCPIFTIHIPAPCSHEYHTYTCPTSTRILLLSPFIYMSGPIFTRIASIYPSIFQNITFIIYLSHLHNIMIHVPVPSSQ